MENIRDTPTVHTNMEDDGEFAVVERERFQQCYRRLIALNHRDDEQSKTNFNLLIDELNSMEYHMKIVQEEVFHFTTLVSIRFANLTISLHRFHRLLISDGFIFPSVSSGYIGNTKTFVKG